MLRPDSLSCMHEGVGVPEIVLAHLKAVFFGARLRARGKVAV